MGEAKQNQIEAQGYGTWVDPEYDEERPQDEPWPSDIECQQDSEREQ